MALAAWRMGGGGLEPPVDPDESRRPTAARTLGERQRFVVVGEMEGREVIAVRPPVGSAETPRAKRASNSHAFTGKGFQVI